MTENRHRVRPPVPADLLPGEARGRAGARVISFSEARRGFYQAWEPDER